MQHLTELGQELEDTLRLHTKIIAYKRLEKADELDSIKNVARIDYFYTFCQAPFMVRVTQLTIGMTNEDQMNRRCMRLCGLRETSEKGMNAEAAMLATTWFKSPEEALKQQKEYPRIPAGGAIVLAPLTKGKFAPDVIWIFGNAAQIMLIMCGLQKDKYERFSFSFIGEGACADALGQCYVTGKPALSIPCYGERSMGNVADDEITIALPPGDLERAVSGLKQLAKVGFKYPINFIGPSLDPTPALGKIYPDLVKRG